MDRGSAKNLEGTRDENLLPATLFLNLFRKIGTQVRSDSLVRVVPSSGLSVTGDGGDEEKEDWARSLKLGVSLRLKLSHNA